MSNDNIKSVVAGVRILHAEDITKVEVSLNGSTYTYSTQGKHEPSQAEVEELVRHAFHNAIPGVDIMCMEKVDPKSISSATYSSKIH